SLLQRLLAVVREPSAASEPVPHPVAIITGTARTGKDCHTLIPRAFSSWPGLSRMHLERGKVHHYPNPNSGRASTLGGLGPRHVGSESGTPVRESRIGQPTVERRVQGLPGMRKNDCAGIE